MGRRKKGDPVSGWICLDKPLDLTSTDAVSRVRRAFNAQKAGHAGTLDPLASGILPIALGEATKTVPYLMEADKTYCFTIAWGETTASFDREGAVTATSDARPAEAAIRAALPAFVGEIQQIPPMFSAIKVDGERAYDLAREGIEVELKARTVRIDRCELVEATADHATLEVDCGKGTYIRAIVRDLAEMAHRGAGSEAILPVETALDDIPVLAITTEDVFKLKQGRPIVLVPRQVEALKARLVPKIIGGEDASRTVSAMANGQVVALCELRAGRLNPTRVFHLDLEI
jgi:tRNA pseudouridine55 synthase